MTSETPSTRQIGSNNENFTIGSYNGFEIMIHDSDGFVNATKLVQQINEKEQTRIQLTNITRSPVFVEYKQYLEQSGLFNLKEPLCYLLPTAFMNDVRGTYVHKQLLNIICIKSSVKYLHHVTTIMDKINETIIAEHEADKTQAIAYQYHSVINTVTDTLSDRITELNQKYRQIVPKTVPNGKERTYILIVEEVSEDEQLEEQQEDHIIIRIRRINKKDLRPAKIERSHRESLLFVDNLPIAMTINEKITVTLQQRQDVKIWSTHYTFPEDQLDFIIDTIQAVINTERAH
ncbi:MAG: hypothetical protein EZS28_028882 [Streblomastix strix]|uniref:KilA-N domain-containing protein n=1 Tax=Streblomastix strix TaxID=222440 RepID=A0A5J4UZN7_9EUKA|nr:MAG: hypothetical protein EZS28_028882 [Streblomastix strix]